MVVITGLVICLIFQSFWGHFAYGSLINEHDHEEAGDIESINSRLTAALLKRHPIKSRPVTHPHDGVKVNVLCALYQIVDVDQRSNLATMSAYFDLWWQDRYLMWNVSDYGGATQTYLPSEMVWTPDLYLYHSVQGSTPLAVQQSAVQITYDGTVRVFIPFTARAICLINVKYFPFDSQRCEFVFGSWSYRLESVEYIVASEEVWLSDFYDNQEWTLINSTLHQTTSLYMNSAFNETYSTVTLKVSLQRQSFYYVFNLVLPVTLVTVVSLIGFHCPANSTERRESKFRLGIMTLLSMGVLLLNVVNDMPKFSMTSNPGNRGSFSDVPLLGLFYIALIVIISVGTMSTGIFVLLEKHALHHPEEIPFWLVWLNFNWPNWKTKRQNRRQKTEKDCEHFLEHDEKNSQIEDYNFLSVKPSDNKVTDNELEERELQVQANVVGKNINSPKTTRCTQNNHISRVTTPPSYRQAVAAPKRISQVDDQQSISPKISNELRATTELGKTCVDILNEIRFTREFYEKRASRKLDPHKEHLLLSKDWSRVIHRFEFLSLIFYLCLVGTTLIMFFAYWWY